MYVNESRLAFALILLASGFLVACATGPEPLVDQEETPVEDYWVLTESPAPEYPEDADGVSGKVTVLVLIDSQGRVDEVQLVEAEPDERFVRSVLEALMEFRFEPGDANAENRPMYTQFEFEFEPEE